MRSLFDLCQIWADKNGLRVRDHEDPEPEGGVVRYVFNQELTKYVRVSSATPSVVVFRDSVAKKTTRKTVTPWSLREVRRFLDTRGRQTDVTPESRLMYITEKWKGALAALANGDNGDV